MDGWIGEKRKRRAYSSRRDSPGSTKLTLIPSGSTSYMRDSTSPSTAHLVAQYAVDLQRLGLACVALRAHAGVLFT